MHSDDDAYSDDDCASPSRSGDDIAATLNRWATLGLVPADIETLLTDAASEIVRLRDGWGVWHAEYMEADANANLWKALADILYLAAHSLVATGTADYEAIGDAVATYEAVTEHWGHDD